MVKLALSELGVQVPRPMKILTDNQGAAFIAHKPIGHFRLKHIALDQHFVREQTENGDLVVQHISGMEQFANMLTKPLPPTMFIRQQPNLIGEPPRD